MPDVGLKEEDTMKDASGIQDREQANHALRSSLCAKDSFRVQAAWQNNLLTDEDRAEAVLCALMIEEDSIAAWMLKQSNLSIPALTSVLIDDDTYIDWSFFLRLLRQERKGSAFEAVLRAVIRRDVNFFDLPLLWVVVARLGGQAAVLYAIDQGCPFQLSAEDGEIREEESVWEFMGYMDNDILTKLTARNMRTEHLEADFAVHRRDLGLLRDSAVDAGSLDHARALTAAIKLGWLDGASLLLDRGAPPVARADCLLQAALEGPDLAFFDLLLSKNPTWTELAFTLAVETGNFAILEHAVQKGWLPPPGKSLPFFWYTSTLCELWYLPPGEWAGMMGELVRGIEDMDFSPLAARATPSARYTAYVVSLIDPETADHLKGEVAAWKAASFSVLQWWNRESRAWADKHPGGGSCHMPDVLEGIITEAELFQPCMWRRAEAVAATIRECIQASEGP
eukprot:jgi/Botrbrau1/14543/Bobra.0212s0010.1